MAVGMYVFAKNESDNISDKTLEDLQTVAKIWGDDPRNVEKDIAAGNLIEVDHESDKGKEGVEEAPRRSEQTGGRDARKRHAKQKGASKNNGP